jgi:predicted enzyme related to lactoylglutathione lyase
MILGTHALIYTDEPDATRAFFRDVLDLPSVDAHDGWLIFKLPPAEMGIHPASPDAPGGTHALYLMCDDIARSVEELTAKGAAFTSPVANLGWGLLTTLRVPGGCEIGLYQPRHATAYDLP